MTTNTNYQFGTWSQEDQVVLAYIVNTQNDKAVDTVYQNIETGRVWTQSGLDLTVYGLSLAV
jgi:hypothetical protein